VPLTYLSHQAAVVPLKMWRPSWLDGTALVFGSMAPDWSYVLNGSRFAVNAHAWPGMVWFAVTVAVVATVGVRRLEPQLVAGLLWRPRWVRDIGRRRPVRRRFVLVVACAALGVLTHVVWDAFTHDFRWGPQHISWLRAQVTVAGRSMSRAHLLQQISTVGGALVTLALLGVISRRRLILDWRREDRDSGLSTPRGDVRVLVAAVAGAALGALWASTVDGDLAAAINRLALTTAVAYAASAAVFIRPRETRHAEQS
jgi:hypothetical protein